jgi:phospholipase C
VRFEPLRPHGKEPRPGGGRPVTRRRVLQAGLAGGVAALVGGCSAATSRAGSQSASGAAIRTGNVALRPPGSRPFPHLPEGTDTIPQIQHIVVVMMENHSYDNWLGMLRRGDGFRLGPDGRPTATNPAPDGSLVRAFRMPTPCQLAHQPSQTWNATHVQYDGGRMQGFVRSPSGPVAMGYWEGADLPFSYALASHFALADRYFASVMAQTYPNRRYLMAGTSLGLVNDTIPDDRPPRGTIFELLDRHGISWRDYYELVPSILLFPYVANDPATRPKLASISQFYADAASGRLPSFCLVEPDYNTRSEENPQDIDAGEQFLAQVVKAVMSGPAWDRTALIWTFDEHGGYYDHVPPPRAPAPDAVPPAITVPPDQPGGFDRYGMRVPMVMVSPYSRKDYVSHVVHDHTSILKLVETKWNLPALTYRDANASDLLDMVDLHRPAFLEPPALPDPPAPAAVSNCQVTGPGQIPPPGAVIRPGAQR